MLVYFCFFHLNHVRIPLQKFSESFANIGHDLAEILLIKKLFVCLFVCLFACLLVYFFVFFHLNHLNTSRKIFWKFSYDWTWFSWDADLKIYLFNCLFVCLFSLTHLGIPLGRFSKNFVKIWLDLAEIFMIKEILKAQKTFFKIGF